MQTIEVRIDRYEELIKKEALLDKLLENKEVMLYLCEKKEAKDA